MTCTGYGTGHEGWGNTVYNSQEGHLRATTKNQGFNEAVGFHRRKRRAGVVGQHGRTLASMRPSAFTDGNPDVGFPGGLPAEASASMRPSAFTDGNERHRPAGRLPAPDASMRPSAFTDGNRTAKRSLRWCPIRCFNVSVGFHRRKHQRHGLSSPRPSPASMRPSAFTDGNGRRSPADHPGGRVASMRPSAFTDGNADQRQRCLPRLHPASMRPSAFTDGNVADRYTDPAAPMRLQ